MEDDFQENIRRGLSVVEAGRQIGLGRNASYQAAKTGQLPVIKIGNRLIVPIVRFKRMLAGETETKG